jgi:hypothetical protein
MFLADEWSHFAKERKPLRVSSPTGLTYFLQLPYRIALPLLVMSGLLHWLVSQSIFLAVVSEYDEIGNEKNRTYLQVSPDCYDLCYGGSTRSSRAFSLSRAEAALSIQQPQAISQSLPVWIRTYHTTPQTAYSQDMEVRHIEIMPP